MPGRTRTPTKASASAHVSFGRHVKTLHDFCGFKPFNDPDDPDPEPVTCHVCDGIAPPPPSAKNRTIVKKLVNEPLFPLTCAGPCGRTWHLRCLKLTTAPTDPSEWFCNDSICKSARAFFAKIVGAPNAFGSHSCSICFQDLSNSSSVENCMFCELSAHKECLSNRVRSGKWICGRMGCVEARKLDVEVKRKEKKSSSRNPEAKIVNIEPRPEPVEVSPLKPVEKKSRRSSIAVEAEDKDEEDLVSVVALKKRREIRSKTIQEERVSDDEDATDSPDPPSSLPSTSKNGITLKLNVGPVVTGGRTPDDPNKAVSSKSSDQQSKVDLEPEFDGSHQPIPVTAAQIEPIDTVDDDQMDVDGGHITFTSKRSRNSIRKLSDDNLIAERTENRFVAKVNAAKKKRKENQLAQQQNSNVDFLPIPKKRKSSVDDNSNHYDVIIPVQESLHIPKTVDPQEDAILKICKRFNDEYFKSRRVSDSTIFELRQFIFNLKNDNSKNTVYGCLVENLTSACWPFLFRKEIDRLMLSLLERDLKTLLDYSDKLDAETRKTKKRIIILYLKFFGRLIPSNLSEKTVVAEQADLARLLERKLCQTSGSLVALMEAKKGSGVEVYTSELVKSCRDCVVIWEKHRQRQQELELERNRKEREIELMQEKKEVAKQSPRTGSVNTMFAPISPGNFISVPKNITPINNMRRDSDDSGKKSLLGVSGKKKLYWHGQSGFATDLIVTVQLASFNPEAPASQISKIREVPEIQDRIAQHPTEQSLLRKTTPPAVAPTENENTETEPIAAEGEDNAPIEFNHMTYLTLNNIDTVVKS
jgi:hypothetical protein